MLDNIYLFYKMGAIAQLGERLRGTQEVGGSIPPSSTILKSSTKFSFFLSKSVIYIDEFKRSPNLK